VGEGVSRASAGGEVVIIPVVTTPTRHHLAVENDERGLASVEVYHGPTLANGRELIEVAVTCEGDDIEVAVRVRQN
jgi:hypothetical protein